MFSTSCGSAGCRLGQNAILGTLFISRLGASPGSYEAVILLGGIGFQPVRNTGKMTGWKPIPRFFHNLYAESDENPNG
jgi:hypothetical protein